MMMKKIYILPNLITTANLVCGVLGMISAIKGDYFRAVWYIVIAGICDGLDGRVARFAKATSSFGVQYDSLSDLTSFGIAPAIITYLFTLNGLDRFGVGVAVFYVVCASLRLARFNVTAEEKPASPISASATKKIRKGYFQGLPSPAAAGIAVTSILFQNEFNFISAEWVPGFFIALTLLLAVLMVSMVPFPSFKEVNWRSKGGAWILLIPAVAILFMIQAPELALFAIGFTYLIFSLFWAGYLCWIRERKQGVISAV
jgi:CDP-diacylglycerol--serine O-phosphatidyltransferase